MQLNPAFLHFLLSSALHLSFLVTPRVELSYPHVAATVAPTNFLDPNQRFEAKIALHPKSY